MKPALSSLLALAIAAAVMPTDANAFTSRSGARVNPVDDVVFEVVPRNGKGWDVWCAAGDYARRELDAAWNARVFVVRGRGPSVTTNRRTAVHFTLNPDRTGVSPTETSSPNVFGVGNNMTVRQAFDFCMGNMTML